MGEFHTICYLLSTIGKRFQDAGLRDLCVESGVMEGRTNNRAVGVHKIVYEAMMRLAWKGFLLWIHANHGADVHHLEEALKSISTFQDEVSHTSSTALMDDASCTRMLILFQGYLVAIGNNNPLTAFWTSYVDMAEITLGLLRAAREGDWLLHLASIRAMIPWLFAYVKVNYACFLSYYYAIMSRLPTDHPARGEPTVHARWFQCPAWQQNPFGRITVDRNVEETVNRDKQTAGDTKGFSLNLAAVERYYLTSEYRSMYLRQLRKMDGHGKSHPSHPDLHMPRITGMKLTSTALEDDCMDEPFRSK